jgi:hypothetical protein
LCERRNTRARRSALIQKVTGKSSFWTEADGARSREVPFQRPRVARANGQPTEGVKATHKKWATKQEIDVTFVHRSVHILLGITHLCIQTIRLQCEISAAGRRRRQTSQNWPNGCSGAPLARPARR